MCGRYTLRKSIDNVWISEESHLSLHVVSQGGEAEQPPRYNIAPTQLGPVLRWREQDASLERREMRWGLIPSWSKTAQTRSPLINARAETVADKPAFRSAFRRRRCLVPADGFYEWKQSRGGNQPFFFHLKDDSVFYMAGLWETWFGELGEVVESYTILTTRANALLSRYHDRMPVILQGPRIFRWLKGAFDQLSAQELLDLMAPIDANQMEAQPANPVVNNNRSEGPQCLEAPPETPVSQLDLGL